MLSATALYANSSDTNIVRMKRFDRVLSSIGRGERCDTAEIFRDFGDAIDSFVVPLLGDTALSKSAKLETFANLRNIFFFYDEIDRAFPNTDSLQIKLDTIGHRFNTIFHHKFPDVTTIVSPYNQSIIMLNDTVAAIALNHYLGRDYPPYQYYPSYIRDFKIPEKITYNLTEAVLRTHYRYEPSDTTLLERIVYEGAVAYAASMTIPTFSEDLYFSFKASQSDWVKASHIEAWQKLIENGALESKDVNLHRSMVAVAPFTSAVSPQSPGGLGRWFGFHIVSLYLKQRHVSIAHFLDDKMYQRSKMVLKQSKYGKN